MSVYSKCLLIVLVLSLLGSRVQAADVVISNAGTIDVNSGQGYDLGQTFTATKTGRLTKIGVAVYSGAAAGTASLKVFAGNSSSGTLLYTKTGINFSGVDTVTNSNTYTFFEISIDSTVNLTSGQIYTFVLSPGGAFDLAFKGDPEVGGTGAGYAGGAMYSDDNGGLLAEYDLVFSVTQSDPPATVPGAPTIGAATAGSGQATVTFTAPASDGGSPITGYTVTSSPGGITGTGASSPITVTGLTNGQAYTFSVTATNGVGTGSASAASNGATPKAAQSITFANPGAQTFGTAPTLTATSSSGLTVTFSSSTTGVCTITSDGALTFVTAGTCTIDADQAGNAATNAAPTVTRSFSVNPTTPGAPTIGTATAGDAQASVTFTAPASTGGASITGYTVTANPGGATATGAASPITVTGLTNGVAYTFTVTATNSAGTSAASAASNSVTPKAAQVITFNNPGAQNFGTTPTLTATSDSGLTPTFTSSTTGVCTITSGGALTFVTAGTCSINADQAGNGSYLPASQVTRSFTVNAVVPGAPTIGTATAGDAQVSVAFAAPASTGGASITGYTVTANPGGATGAGAASPITITGLTNGVAYTFTVTATNAAGTGAASAASNSVTPAANQAITFANPGAQNFGTSPTLTATSDSGLTPTFTSSTTGVCTITSGGALTFVTVGTCTINADQAGNASYLAAAQVSRSFTVNAVVPGAPAITSAAAGDSQATVAFAAPASNGGSSITGYTVTATPGGLAASGLASPVVVTGLTNGTTYTFTVAATNGIGTGAASAASAPVTPAAPAPPAANTPPAPVNQCFVSFDPVALIVPAAGELGTLDLLADSGCAWTVVSPASWLRVEPASGVGAATLSYVAQPNAAAMVREARVSAASASVVQLLVSQQGRGGIDGAPLELSALAAHRTVRLAWQLPAGAGVIDHIVEIGSAPGQSDLATLRTNSAVAGFTAENVPVGTYYVRVRGVTAAGASGASNEVIVRIEDAVGGVPAPPLDLAPSSTDAARMGVRWSASPATAATGFIVEFGSAPGLSDLARVSVLDTRLEWDASIAPTNAFYVRVRAVNGFGEGAPSNEIVMTRSGAAVRVPARPQALAATYENQTLSVSWAPPADGGVATGYVLEIGSSAGASNLLQTTTTATSWAHAAPANVVYYIRVRALNAAGAGAPSDEAVVNAGVDVALVPGAPENLAAQLHNGLLTLQWTAAMSSAAAGDFIVEAGSAPGLSDVGIIPTGNGATVWTFEGVPGDRTFHIRVRGRNAAGVGAASNEIRIGPGQ